MDIRKNTDKRQDARKSNEVTYKMVPEIVPDRELSILYTEEPGGEFKYIAKNTPKETLLFYKEILRTGTLNFRKGDLVVKIRPAYVTLNERVDGYDFSTKTKRI